MDMTSSRNKIMEQYLRLKKYVEGIKNIDLSRKESEKMSKTYDVMDAMETDFGNVSLVSPWVDFFYKVSALFHEDPDVAVIFNNEKYELVLLVKGADKAEAIQKLIGTERKLGDRIVKITVNTAKYADLTKADYIRKAFAGNPALVDVVVLDPKLPTIGGWTYSVFKAEVVQYRNDDISDLNLRRSCLYQDIAAEVFGEDPGFYYCTERVDAEEK